MGCFYNSLLNQKQKITMRNIILVLTILMTNAYAYSSRGPHRSDAHIIGHVVSGGKHIPFVTISLRGTTIGTSTDETGHYKLINVPTGKYVIVASAIGYKSVDHEIEVLQNQTLEVNFSLEEDAIGLDEVVVTADRSEQRRSESSVIISTISPKTFTITQSVVLSDGLSYSPGLRVEKNCVNCGFNQLRMNGLEGPYSQILINSRPIFSGLAGVYGLELIPANMVERVEVIRGGGSALHGSNAIAGTVNLILKDPINNSYELALNSAAVGVGMSGTGGITPDNNASFNASVVSSDVKTGLAVYGFFRDKPQFDANGDGFSEISMMENTSIGARGFHRFGHRSKVSVDIFNIQEDRRGGDLFDKPLHQANVAEAVNHRITTGAVTYDQFFRESDVLSVFASAQRVNRGSYYGAAQSLVDYGTTNDITYVTGAQYSAKFKPTTLTVGIESQGGWLVDKKLGYPDYDNAIIVNDSIVSIPHTDNTTVTNQSIRNMGAFSQLEYKAGRFKTTLGARFDHYRVFDRENSESAVSGNVISPRVTMMYEIMHGLQGRISYARGYRAPQVFDEDLHILTSTARRVIHRNDPNLKQETSHSFMASLDYSHKIGSSHFNLLVEGFYTQLQNPFANEFGEPDENGIVIYTRVNAEEGATVSGVTLDLALIPSPSVTLRSGFTIQQSLFAEPQEFDQRRFFRSPNSYGYFTLGWDPETKLGASVTGTYTGSMLVPYFGPTLTNPEAGELRTSNPFLDLGMRLRYNLKVNGATFQLFGGVKNLLNSYQNDFDTGMDRDPGYLYGPTLPRTIYFGIRIGNRLR